MANSAILSIDVGELQYTLRPWRLDDIENSIKYGNNVNVYKAVSRLPHPYTRKDAEWWINKCMDMKDFLPKKWAAAPSAEAYLPSTYVIALEDQLIGSIGLTQDPNNQYAVALGYWLAEPFW